MTQRLRPLSERILARLPGSRVLWICAWALVPWLNAGLNLLLEEEARSAVWEQGRTLVILNYAAVSFAIGLTLWGAKRIARQLETLRAETADALDVEPSEHFREVNSVAWPALASTVTALGFAATALVADGWLPALLRVATWLVIGIPIWSFLWTYGSLLVGLDRVGRERLHPDASRVDPTLGLRPLGAVAFTGLWILLAALVPVLLTGLSDVVGVVIGAIVLGGAVAAFFLSLFRLHRQMVDVKRSELALARDLYEQAYEPVREQRTLEALERQHSLLGAADALEKRAHAIHEWPLDEGTVTRVVTIATSVTAISVARLVLDPLGL